MISFKDKSGRILLALLLGLYLISLFLNINQVPLKFEEPRRALVALEMMLSDNFIVPKINGTLYLNKLPMFNWVLIAFFQLTGSLEEWVIRLPTILSLLAIGGIIFWITNKYIDRITAIFATFFWLTSADIYFHFSVLGEIDIFYSLLVVIQVLSVFYFYQKRNYYLLFLGSYIFMALGILTKGLPSIAFQALTLFFFAVFTKNFKKLFTLPHLVGLLSAALILGAYFMAYAQYESLEPLFIRQFTESTDRTAASNKLLSTLIQLVSFPFNYVKIILPWGLFLLLFFHKRVRTAFKENAFLKFSMVFIAVNIVPYWLSPGTKDRYLYMFIPFFMIASAWIYTHFYAESKWRKFINVVFLIFIILLLVVSAGLPFIKELAFLTHVKWISYAFMIAFFVCLWFYIKKKEYRTTVFLFAFVIARVLFDVTVLPARRVDAEERKAFESVVKDVIRKSEGKQVYLLADKKNFEFDLPVMGEVNFSEVQWPDFGLSYYYSKNANEVLSYAENSQKGQFFLTLKEYYDETLVHEGADSFVTLGEYYIPKRDQTYLLLRAE